MLEITNEALFGMLLTSFLYIISKKINEKFKLALLNPIVLTMLIIITILKLFNIPYENYYKGAEIYNRLIVPATVSLAIPLYKNYDLLKKYAKEILLSIGIMTLVLLFLLAFMMAIFNIELNILASVLPKSVTTAIAVGITEKLNGIPSITIIMVIICGTIGALFGESIFKIFNIKNTIAQGISLGVSSHAIGTSKALELGELQGAMSGLAIIITGIFTVVFSPIVYNIIVKIFY